MFGELEKSIKETDDDEQPTWLEKVQMKRIVYLIAGIFFLILGMIGLVLPVIPQVPFFIMAVLLLTKGSEKVRRFITGSKLYRKYLKGKNIKWLKELQKNDTQIELR